MKFLKPVIFAMSYMISTAAHSADCPEGELRFTFSNLDVLSAFAIFADYAKLKPVFDPSIRYSSPMNFGCTPWRQAAQDLADKYNLRLKIENGVMYVKK